MKWLSAGLVFVNLSTVCGLLLGMAGKGLNERSAIFALVSGAAFAVAAYLGTSDRAVQQGNVNSPVVKQKPSNSERRRLESVAQESTSSPVRRFRHLWLWVMTACFAMFAVRSFCWLLYVDGNELKIQSPNNLGDLALHITLIRNFANGVTLWPDNPIYVFSKLRYPAGIDLFNALLCLVHVNLVRGLVWTGLLASLATFYAFFRWAGTFGVAGFLFNGGMAGFQFFKTLKFLDYQGDKTIAWKSIALSMFVTQRGLLYAIPAGLLLLWHWREKFFRTDAGIRSDDSRSNAAQLRRNGPLPYWVELSLYASMPLFHVHTFLALTIVLFFLFVSECLQPLKLIISLLRTEGIDRIPPLIWDPATWRKVVGDTRMHPLTVVAGALLPASRSWIRALPSASFGQAGGCRCGGAPAPRRLRSRRRRASSNPRRQSPVPHANRRQASFRGRRVAPSARRDRLPPAGVHNIRLWIGLSVCDLGLGQSQADDVGLFSRAPVSMDGSHCALDDSRPNRSLHRTFRIGIYHYAWGIGCRASGLWICRSRRTRRCWRCGPTFAGRGSLRRLPDLQSSAVAPRTEGHAWLSRPPVVTGFHRLHETLQFAQSADARLRELARDCARFAYPLHLLGPRRKDQLFSEQAAMGKYGADCRFWRMGRDLCSRGDNATSLNYSAATERPGW